MYNDYSKLTNSTTIMGVICMSKDYCGFSNEGGETAFLAGVVDVLSDELSMFLDYAYALDADIFHVEDNNISLLNDAVKKRLHSYKDKYGCSSIITDEKTDAIDIQLQKSYLSADAALLDYMKKNSDKKEIEKAVSEFLRNLKWYLGEPIGVYTPVRKNDKNIDVISDLYLGIACDYFFIEYNQYFVMIVFGTSE